MFFRKNNNKNNTKKQTDRDLANNSNNGEPPRYPLPKGPDYFNSPTIVNNTHYPIVVFLERGTLFNPQVLLPGQAVCMTKEETGILPYKVHAVIGDEAALPTHHDSLKNLVVASIIPAAFCVGCLAAAYSAGTLTGPSAAMTGMVRGMVVKGVVLDTATMAAGTAMASKAKFVSQLLLEKKKDHFVAVSPTFLPGQRYLSVTGGLDHGAVKIEQVPRRKAHTTLLVSKVKAPRQIGQTTTATTTTSTTATVTTGYDNNNKMGIGGGSSSDDSCRTVATSTSSNCFSVAES